MTSNQKKRIAVSHPGKQYVNHLLHVVQNTGMLTHFFTSIWFKPSLFVYKLILVIPILGSVIFNKFLRKKTYKNQNDQVIEQYWWPEFVRQLLCQFSYRFRQEKYVFWGEKLHDKHVAKRILKTKPDVFIGYEKSSLESFKAVKSYGGTTILDLAQVHYQHLIDLRKETSTFNELFEDIELFNQINKRKEEEYKYADYVLTLSSFAKETLIKNGIPETKIKTISLGYDPAVFTPKTTYNEAGKPFTLIYSGTFTKRKGVHHLLQAFVELNLPNAQLIIIGPVLDGMELFEEYKGKFIHYDFLYHEDLVKQLHQADIYVFPSLLDSWAMTVVEAMACGLPVIVTESTGAKDVVDENCGFIISHSNLPLLKEKINFFFYNKEMIKKMGTASAAKALNHTWGKYNDKVQDFLNN